MVEFPLVVPAERKGFATLVRNLSQIPPVADITFLSSSRRLAQVRIKLVCGKLSHSLQASTRG
jgi:hypothetical protein